MGEIKASGPGTTITWLILSGGVLMTLAGVTFCAMYVVEAFIKRIGEADQSLLFWYLPILFMGLFSLMAGLGLLAWGRNRKKS